MALADFSVWLKVIFKYEVSPPAPLAIADDDLDNLMAFQ